MSKAGNGAGTPTPTRRVAARTAEELYAEVTDPVSGRIDPEWIRKRVKYRRPVGYYFTMHSSSGRAMKRALDVVGSLGALLAFSPIFAATALAIVWDDPGPVFFRQRRNGTGGRHFGFWKFRSMVTDAEKLKAALMAQNESKDGVIFKMKNDPRITRVGRFIRKYSIDELPQFYNVLCGDMSLVGPRPPVPGEVAQYDDEAWRRLEVIPGLTCIWQVSGRSSIGFRDQVRRDLEYVLRQDLFLDIRLLLKTVPAVLKGEGAF